MYPFLAAEQLQANAPGLKIVAVLRAKVSIERMMSQADV